MLLIICKVKFRLRWTNHWVLSTAAGADNGNANPNNISFTMKDTKLYVLVVTLSAKENRKLSKSLSKRSVDWNGHKTKCKNNWDNLLRFWIRIFWKYGPMMMSNNDEFIMMRTKLAFWFTLQEQAFNYTNDFAVFLI